VVYLILLFLLFVLAGYAVAVIAEIIYLSWKFKKEIGSDKIKYPCERCGAIIEANDFRRKYCDECKKKMNSNNSKKVYHRKKNEGLF